MSARRPRKTYQDIIKEDFLTWFDGVADECTERKFRADTELPNWFNESADWYPPGWLWYAFGLLKESFACWYLGRFMATVLICQAACEVMLAELFEKSGEDEKKTVKKLGGNWEKLKKSLMMRRIWILFKEEIISQEIYDGLTKVRKVRNEVAHEGSPKTVQEILALPWLNPKEAEENAWKALRFAVLLYDRIYFKYPAGPYREQFLAERRKRIKELEKREFGF